MVIDDDALIREQIESFCDQIEFIDYCLKIEDGVSALNILSSGDFDLVFLDLNMPKIKGSELIKHLNPEAKVVIVSSDSGFAVEAFDYNVVGYLLKPFELSDFLKVVNKLRPETEENRDILFVKDGRSLVKIDLSTLVYVKSESNYARFMCKGNKTLALMKLSDLEGQLPAHFQRVHRSYIVNIKEIDKISNDKIETSLGEIPCGASYKDKLVNSLERL